MSTKEYTMEYKIEAVKLAKEIGVAKAMAELGIPKGTLYGWIANDIVNITLHIPLKLFGQVKGYGINIHGA